MDEAFLDDDISEGFVWLKRTGLAPRSVVKITNPDGGRSVFCEALQLEDNFLREYNQAPRLNIEKPESSIIMSAWYRARLGNLETQREYNLEIRAANGWWGKLRFACSILRSSSGLPSGLVSSALRSASLVSCWVWSVCGQGSSIGSDERPNN